MLWSALPQFVLLYCLSVCLYHQFSILHKCGGMGPNRGHVSTLVTAQTEGNGNGRPFGMPFVVARKTEVHLLCMDGLYMSQQLNRTCHFNTSHVACFATAAAAAVVHRLWQLSLLSLFVTQ